ncbi:hypothetical protein [Weissella tructae]
MTNKVTHAPKPVIDELDNAREEVVVKSLFAVEIISCLVNEEGDYPHAEQWFDSDSKVIPVMNHLMGNERLQPEREPRYYVEFYDDKDMKWFVRASEITIVDTVPEWAIGTISYDCGLDHETAVKAQALYGGTIEEIK